MPELFVVVAEQSGDLLAADLIGKLQKEVPDLYSYGVVGNCLRKAGVEEIAGCEELSVMGFSDVIKALPRLIRIFNLVRDAIIRRQPDVVLLVDAPSFNLRMARALRQRGYEGDIIQYISPTVWAWGSHRKEEMAENLDLLLSIYPFEKEHFKDSKLKVEYVGHPLSEKLSAWKPNPCWREDVGIDKDKKLISLFPGSRVGEIKRNLPLMLSAVQHLPSDYLLAISAANSATHSLINEITSVSPLPYKIIPAESGHYDQMSQSEAALAKSGTITLELALLSCPTVVTYKLSLLNKWMAKYILKVNLPYYCIVNILANEEIFPEYIAEQPTTKNLSDAIDHILNQPSKREKVLQGCNKVKQILSEGNASVNAVALIKEALL